LVLTGKVLKALQKMTVKNIKSPVRNLTDEAIDFLSTIFYFV